MAKRTVKKKKKGVKELKKDLKELVHEYIKIKHSVDGYDCVCISCGKHLPRFKDDGNKNGSCNAGHFIPVSASEFLRFHPDNIRPQCVKCNLSGEGEQVKYRRALVAEIGEDRVLWLESNRYNLEKRGVVYYEEQIEKYKQLLKQIK